MAHPHPLDQLPVTAGITVATLSLATGTIAAISLIVQNYKPVTFHGVISLTPLTDGDGPLLFGFSQGSLTLAEIEEYLEAAPDAKTQSPAVEQVQRPVQVLGALGTDMQTVFLREKIILPHFREDTGFVFWIYNAGAVVFTTGSTVKIRGRFFGRWID